MFLRKTNGSSNINIQILTSIYLFLQKIDKPVLQIMFTKINWMFLVHTIYHFKIYQGMNYNSRGNKNHFPYNQTTTVHLSSTLFFFRSHEVLTEDFINTTKSVKTSPLLLYLCPYVHFLCDETFSLDVTIDLMSNYSPSFHFYTQSFFPSYIFVSRL